MNFKRKISWLFLIITWLGASMSCQSIGKNHKPQPLVDTSLWLRETRGIRGILEDSKGNLWFSSPDYVAMFDGKEMHYFAEADGLSITGNLHKGTNGTIWVENGVQIFRYKEERFVEEKIDSISSPSVLWIQRGLSPADTTYVEPGLYEASQEITKFYPLPVEEKVNNKYLYYPTTKAYFGKDSTVWIGTMEKVFGLKNDSFVTLGREEMGRQDDERQMGVRGIFVDSKGKLWMADNGAGVFVFDGKQIENFTKKYRLDEGSNENHTLHRAFSIAEDSVGNMWFGTVYSGIWRFNPQTEEFKNYTQDHGVISENIWTIYRTESGKLLFAGESPAAVYEFNGKTFDRIY